MCLNENKGDVVWPWEWPRPFWMQGLQNAEKYKKPQLMNKNVNLVIILAVALFSCSNINERKLGDWDDNIHLSTKTVEFNAASDSVIIKTGGSWWWVSSISVDSKCYFNFLGVDLQSDHYKIKQDCFVVERRDKNTLFIKVEANPDNAKRIISVGLEAGDYFDRVTVTQKSKGSVD